MSSCYKTYRFLSLFIITLLLFVVSLSTANTCSNAGKTLPCHVTCCKTRACILSFGFRPIYNNVYNGKYIEGYANPNKQSGVAYTARRVGHAVMCFATLGLWEIAMDPIERSAGNIIVEATYPNEDSCFVERITVRGDY